MAAVDLTLQKRFILVMGKVFLFSFKSSRLDSPSPHLHLSTPSVAQEWCFKHLPLPTSIFQPQVLLRSGVSSITYSHGRNTHPLACMKEVDCRTISRCPGNTLCLLPAGCVCAHHSCTLLWNAVQSHSTRHCHWEGPLASHSQSL